MLCSEASLVNASDIQGHAVSLKCKRWSCPICAPLNRKQVIRKGRQGKPNAFLTLTCNPHGYECPDDAARDLKHAWVVLRRRIEKRYARKNIPFLAVFERTKRGWPHLHLLIRAPWLDQKWLSDQMADLINAPIVDIRKIDDEGRAARYVTKYVGKDPHVFEGCKRWWRSHNYDLGEDERSPLVTYGSRWVEERKPLATVARELKAMGYYITEERDGFIAYQRWWVREKEKERPPARSLRSHCRCADCLKQSGGVDRG